MPNQPTLGYTHVQSCSEARLSSGRLGHHSELKSSYGSHSGGVTGLMFTGQGMDSKAREECYLYDQAPETIDHILCCCPFARELWFRICQALGHQLPPLEQSVYAWWRRLRPTWNQ